MEYYADAEGGAYLEEPTHADLTGLVNALNSSDNTFFIVNPADRDLEWFVSVSKNVGTFGGYQIRRNDPDDGGLTATTAADPNTIADDVLDWVRRR